MFYLVGHPSTPSDKNVWAYADGPSLSWSDYFGTSGDDYMQAALLDSTNGKLYVGGLDDDSTGYNLFRLTASDGSGEIGRDVGSMSQVRCIAQKADYTLIVGGNDSSSHGLFEVAADLSSETAIGTAAVRTYGVIVASDGKIYAAREFGYLEKWSDGEYVNYDWRVDLGAGAIQWLNELSNGNIVCADTGSSRVLHCRSIAAGAEVWTNNTSFNAGYITCVYVDSNNDIYVCWNATNISKVDPTDGSVTWTEDISKEINWIGEDNTGILVLAGVYNTDSVLWTFDQSTKTLTSMAVNPYSGGAADESEVLWGAGTLVVSVTVDVEIAGTIAGSSTVSGTITSREIPGWPEIRWPDYDETLIYDEDAGDWIAVDGSGGSRYQTQLVAVGYNDDGNGVVYFGNT